MATFLPGHLNNKFKPKPKPRPGSTAQKEIPTATPRPAPATASTQGDAASQAPAASGILRPPRGPLSRPSSPALTPVTVPSGVTLVGTPSHPHFGSSPIAARFISPLPIRAKASQPSQPAAESSSAPQPSSSAQASTQQTLVNGSPQSKAPAPSFLPPAVATSQPSSSAPTKTSAPPAPRRTPSLAGSSASSLFRSGAKSSLLQAAEGHASARPSPGRIPPRSRSASVRAPSATPAPEPAVQPAPEAPAAPPQETTPSTSLASPTAPVATVSPGLDPPPPAALSRISPAPAQPTQRKSPTPPMASVAGPSTLLSPPVQSNAARSPSAGPSRASASHSPSPSIDPSLVDNILASITLAPGAPKPKEVLTRRGRRDPRGNGIIMSNRAFRDEATKELLRKRRAETLAARARPKVKKPKPPKEPKQPKEPKEPRERRPKAPKLPRPPRPPKEPRVKEAVPPHIQRRRKRKSVNLDEDMDFAMTGTETFEHRSGSSDIDGKDDGREEETEDEEDEDEDDEGENDEGEDENEEDDEDSSDDTDGESAYGEEGLQVDDIDAEVEAEIAANGEAGPAKKKRKTKASAKAKKSANGTEDDSVEAKPVKPKRVKKPKAPKLPRISFSQANLIGLEPGTYVGDELDTDLLTMADIATNITHGQITERGVVLAEASQAAEAAAKRQRGVEQQQAFERRQLMRRKLRAGRNAHRAAQRAIAQGDGRDDSHIPADDPDSDEEFAFEPENLEPPDEAPRPNRWQPKGAIQTHEAERNPDAEEGAEVEMQYNEDGELEEGGDDYYAGFTMDEEPNGDGEAAAADATAADDLDWGDAFDIVDEAGVAADEEEDDGEPFSFENNFLSVDEYRDNMAENRRAAIENAGGRVVEEEVQPTRMVNSRTWAKKTRNARWPDEETDYFFVVLQETGPVPTIMAYYFPDRDEKQLTNKLVRERKDNKERYEAAVTQRKPMDATLLDKTVRRAPGIDDAAIDAFLAETKRDQARCRDDYKEEEEAPAEGAVEGDAEETTPADEELLGFDIDDETLQWPFPEDEMADGEKYGEGGEGQEGMEVDDA